MTGLRARVPGLVSLAVLGFGAWMPGDGVSFTICLVYATIGVPCPGCGLTRSVASTLDGDLPQALWFNPMGPVVALALIATAITTFLPQARLEATWTGLGQLFRERRKAFDVLFYTYLAFTGVRGTLAVFDLWPWWS